MSKHVIIKLDVSAAMKAVIEGRRVFQLCLDEFECIREIRYMQLDEILEADKEHDVVYLEEVRDE